MVSILLLALAAEPAVSGRAEPDVPRIAVSIYPGGMLAGAGYGYSRNGSYLYLPIGLSFPVRADLSIDVDLAGSYNRQNGVGDGGGSFSVSAGPTWFPFARQGLDGFYIGPRFQFEVSKPLPEPIFFDFGPSGPLSIGHAVRRAFLVGLDLGWQFRVGRVVFGPVAGASIGYAFDNQENVLSPFDRQVLFFNTAFPSGFVPSVNLSLFKVGGVF